jgi:hypothetical protein
MSLGPGARRLFAGAEETVCYSLRSTPVWLVWLVPVSSLGKEWGFFPVQGCVNALPQESRFRHQVVNMAEGFRERRHREL